LVKVKLHFGDAPIYLLPERHRIELVFARLVKPFAYPVGLRRFRFCSCTASVLDFQIQGILMMFPVPAILAATIRQDPQQRKFMSVKEGNNSVIERIGGNLGVLPAIRLAKRRFAIGVYEGLPADVSRSLDIPRIIRVLSHQIPRMLRFYLPMSFFLFFRSLKGRKPAFGQYEVFPRRLRLKRPQPPFEGCHVMPQPDAAYPAGEDQYSALA
jgi:hypothetical protein